MIRKTLIGITSIIGLVLGLVVLGVMIIVIKPEIVVNQLNLEKILRKYVPITYQLSTFKFEHTYHSFFDRDVKVSIRDFSFDQTSENSQILGELKNLDFNFKILYQDGLRIISPQMNLIHFKNLQIKLTNSKPVQDRKILEPKYISLKDLYQQLWSDILPEIELRVDKVAITQDERKIQFPLKMEKTQESLKVEILEFQLNSNPQKTMIALKRPENLWQAVLGKALPQDLTDLDIKIHFHLNDQSHLIESNLSLLAGTTYLRTTFPNNFDVNMGTKTLSKILQKIHIKVDYPNLGESLVSYLPKNSLQQIKKNQVNAAFQSEISIGKALSSELEIVMKSLVNFDVRSTALQLKHLTHFDIDTEELLKDPVVLIKKSSLGTEAELKIEQITSKWKNFQKNAFQLPAPLNSLDGDLYFLLSFSQIEQDNIQAEFSFGIDLFGHQQNLKISSKSNLPFNPSSFFTADLKKRASSIGTIETQINIEQVNIRLPNWRPQPGTPQFVPDARIKKERASLKTSPPTPTLDMDFRLKTPKESPIKVATNLLDSPLRFAVDLRVKGDQKNGVIDLLPLTLEIFKRKISIENLRIKIADPALPEIKGLIQFHLPQYLISLQLEGTSEQMRHHFTSDPPLPQGDIYAVLLFGRPMTELSGDDRAAANQTQQILSDGLLSLSVLYFLSGGPIQSIGFNPDSQSVSAQIGLTKNSSLNVSTSASGQNRASVRRSLGSGWYIDTSVQNSSQPTSTKQSDYGVLLEKIMAY